MSVLQPVTFTPTEVLAGGSGGFPYDVRVLSQGDDPAEVYRLRCEAYRAQGWVNGESFSDATDALAQSVQIAAFKGEQCICAARITFKGWNEPISVLPCARYYPALQSAGLRKLSIAELSHIVVDPAVSDPTHRLVFYSAMVRAGLLAVQAARVALLVVAAQPGQLEFYQHVLHFHVVGPPASYPPAPAQSTLLGINMVGAGRRHVERVAFFKTVPKEISSMRDALLRCLGNAAHARVLAQSVDGPGA